ncbi:MAG: tetratricopeptide repeat protein [Pirellulales bacterium]
MITEVFTRSLTFAVRAGVFGPLLGLVVLTGCGGSREPAPQELTGEANPPRKLPVSDVAVPLAEATDPAAATAVVVQAASVMPEPKSIEPLAMPWGAIGSRGDGYETAPEAVSPPEPVESPREASETVAPPGQPLLAPAAVPPTHGAGILRAPIEVDPSPADQPTQEANLAEPPVPEDVPAPLTSPAIGATELPRLGAPDEPFMTGTLPRRSAAPATPPVSAAAPSPPQAASPSQVATAAPGPAPRSREMEAVAQRADEHSRRGFELAGRRAYFSARAEFIQSLRLLVQALDAEQRTTEHGQSLARALRALEESDSFVPRGAALESELDVAAIVRAHRTPVLKESDPAGLTALAALQRYYSYAQEQLADAVRPEFAGSVALYGLGKLHAAQATNKGSGFSAGEAKAMVFHQAALLANARNYMAANELGVLLARYGRLNEARTALAYSVSVSPQLAAWQNLAVVHQQLGETALAQQARQRAMEAGASQIAAPAARATGARPAVQWIDPNQFAQSVNVTDGVAGTSGKAPPPPAAANAEKKGLAGWIPWLENPTK